MDQTDTEFWKKSRTVTGVLITRTGLICNSKKKRYALFKDQHGYLYARVYCPEIKKRVQLYAHREVARHFLEPKPKMSYVIRHLDGNRNNNRASNLAWGSHAQNMIDRKEHGRNPAGEKNGNAKLNPRKITLIRRGQEMGFSQTQIARALQVHPNTVARVLQGKTRFHLGANNAGKAEIFNTLQKGIDHEATSLCVE